MSTDGQLPADPFADFGETAGELWRIYTGATAALMDTGFSEDQAKELAYASLLSGISGGGG